MRMGENAQLISNGILNIQLVCLSDVILMIHRLYKNQLYDGDKENNCHQDKLECNETNLA